MRVARLSVIIALCAGLGLVAPGSAAAAPGPPMAPEWWFDAWNVPALWAAGARGQGVTIAEIDTGVNAALPELTGKILPGKDFGGAGGDGRTDRDQDKFGHGTAMASIMVARPTLLDITGLAPDARVLPIAVPIQGTSDASVSDHVPDAIRWAVVQDTVPCPPDEQSAIDYAVARGAIVVAAGGNSGQIRSPVEDPGVCLGVVSVGAVDSHGMVPPFSSRHPYLTLVAPGVGIASLGRVPGAAYLGDGTSQATAITSAALALVWSKYPSLTGRQIVTRVLATLSHRAPTHDLAYGYGSLAVGRAIRAAVPPSAANPVYDALTPFLDREQARAAAASSEPAPQPAATTNAPPGRFEEGAEPGTFTGPVLAGTVAALVGIAILAMLGGMALASRREQPSPIPVAPPPAWPTDSTGGSPPEWQDITGPIWPFAPPPDRRIG
jgi:subtilisin family serine protease